MNRYRLIHKSDQDKLQRWIYNLITDIIEAGEMSSYKNQQKPHSMLASTFWTLLFITIFFSTFVITIIWMTLNEHQVTLIAP